MIVREAMSTPAVTVPGSWSVRQAVRLLHERGVTAVPVVDQAGYLVGVVTETDLLRGEFETDPAAFLRATAAAGEPPVVRVEDVMTTEVRTASESTDLAALAELMITMGLGIVPVLRGDRLVGVLRRHDLMRLVSDSDARVRDDVLAAIRERFPAGPHWTVTVRAGVVRLQGTAGGHAARAVHLLARTVPGVTRVAVVDAPNAV
ncbi:CBS domain-containing protein [Actinomadura alba]|uniref:CBS domain-containing protein n=1 Tax=Actinomadura alba TaxID=406431 RepID=A0ABR7LY52_9ACTN|nr:CBS domain-containing protein [Actinomadura alba]MBC6469778.1 CBS domain-containing protein [Actinomadura alba]